MCLSVVVTAHNEGLVIHKTMNSVFAALENVKKAGYTYEIIVHIDNGDEETKQYFDRYKNRKNFRVFENNFGDTGPSRNFALSKANGEYVAFLDGDDLISDNWYLNAIETLEKSDEEIVVHPEAILTFGIEQPNILTIQKDSLGIKDDTLVLIGENKWCSVLVAKKDTLLKVPYRALGSGYGHEDYVFNVEALEKGILHKVASGTVLFYRRTNNSRLASGNRNNVVIPYMEFFAFENIKKIGAKTVQKNKKRWLKDYGYKTYKKMRDNEKLNRFITPVAKVALRVLEGGQSRNRKKIPRYVLDEWAKINQIDSQLYPYKAVLDRVGIYDPEKNIEVGNAFFDIAKYVTKMPEYVFIVPWIVRGGADKVLFNYIEALKHIHPEWHFAVITTLPAKNTWAKKLPGYVDFIDFGNIVAGLAPYMQDELFSRMIIQLKCKNLHIINSEYGYDWVRRHLDLVRCEYNLNVSLFAWEYIAGSNMKAVYSYDNPCLFEIFSGVKNVFTDNEAMIKYTIEKNGFDKERFRVHYQPIENQVMIAPKQGLVKNKKLRVLWAGRVVPLKLPDLVASIGKHLDPKKVVIDVYGELGDGVSAKMFDDIAAVNYWGAYDGFKSLPTDEYDLLLYTSLTDGMPNVILEATMAGLPIIASNDGGVGEFIKNGKTGILIEDYLNYEPYVEAIEWAMDNTEKLREYVENAQKLLESRHSFKKFVSIVKKDIG